MESGPVYIFARWQVKEGYLDEVLQLLGHVAAESSKEEGNLFYKVHQAYSDVHTLVLYEGYLDEAAVEAHRNSVHFRELVLAQIVPLLESREVLSLSRLHLV